MSIRTHAGRARRLLNPQFAPALLAVLAVEIGIATTTVPRLARLLGVAITGSDEPAPSAVPADFPLAWIRHRSGEVNRVLGRWPFGDTCLRRALALGHRIRRLDPVLVIGVRHDEHGQIAAHAWLVVRGVTLDPQAARFLPMHDHENQG